MDKYNETSGKTAYRFRGKVLHRVYALASISVAQKDSENIDQQVKTDQFFSHSHILSYCHLLNDFGVWYGKEFLSQCSDSQVFAQKTVRIKEPSARSKRRHDITGLLLLLPTYMIHIFECSEDNLVMHLNNVHTYMSCSDAKIQQMKILTVSHDVPKRFFEEWTMCSVPAFPDVVEDPSGPDLREDTLMECAKKCVRHLVLLCTDLNHRSKASRDHVLSNLLKNAGHLLVGESTLNKLLRERQEESADEEDSDWIMSVADFLALYHTPLAIIDDNERCWPMADQYFIY